MMAALVLTWAATAAICVPIITVCAMVVLCVRFIATAPEDPRAQHAARTAARLVTRPAAGDHDDEVTEELHPRVAPDHPRAGPGIGGS